MGKYILKTVCYLFALSGASILNAASQLPSAVERIAMIEPQVFDVSKTNVGMREHLLEKGFVVVTGLAAKQDLSAAAEVIRERSKTDPRARNRGFFDLYHDRSLANLRQHPLMYKTFESIWQEKKLWVVFDRSIYMDETTRENPLALHVDQNPWSEPNFAALQGLLALEDINENTGMLALVPKSQKWFKEYEAWADKEQGYIEYQGSDVLERRKLLRAIPLKAGQMVIWDSRVSHSRALTSVPKGKSKERLLAMITFIPAKNDEFLRGQRFITYKSGFGAYNHASGLRKTGHSRYFAPRKEKETLTELGQKIYGIKSW